MKAMRRGFRYGPLKTVRDIIFLHGKLPEEKFLSACEGYDYVTVAAAYKELFSKSDQDLITDWVRYGYLKR